MASEDSKADAEVTESEQQPPTSRFLQNRQVKKEDSDYHPTYKESSLANLPDLIENRPISDGDSDEKHGDDKDVKREFVELAKPESNISEEEISRLKQETSHLPFDTALKVLAHYNNDFSKAIEAAKEMSMPNYVGQGVQQIFAANVAYEREKNPTRHQTAKEFYMASKFRKHCDTKALVDNYYQQKNRIDSNWRLEQDDEPLTSEVREELQEKMNEAGIRFCRADPQKGPRRGRKRARAVRRPLQRRRDQQPGCSKDRYDEDFSDAGSVASSSYSRLPSSSEGPGAGTSSASLSLASRLMSFQMSSESTSSTPSTSAALVEDSEGEEAAKRKYPDRKRKPKKFFE